MKTSKFPFRYISTLSDVCSSAVTTPGNYSVKSGRIRYTTMLKDKGLEKDVVVLVSSALANRRPAAPSPLPLTTEPCHPNFRQPPIS